MKKNILIITIAIIILIALIATVGVLVAKKNKKEEPKLPPVKIVLNIEDNKREILIENNDEITKLNNYLKEIKEAEKIESNLALLNDIIIVFENNEEVIIQTSVAESCYYRLGEELKLVKMPEGLLSMLAELITKQ